MEIKVTNRKGATVTPKEYARRSYERADLDDALRYAMGGSQKWWETQWPENDPYVDIEVPQFIRDRLKKAPKKSEKIQAQDVELVDGVYIPKT